MRPLTPMLEYVIASVRSEKAQEAAKRELRAVHAVVNAALEHRLWSKPLDMRRGVFLRPEYANLNTSSAGTGVAKLHRALSRLSRSPGRATGRGRR